MPSTSSVLQAESLVKIYGEFTALDGLSFTVAQGESLGLLGVNGAGKTTAMNLLLGLTTPTSGMVRMFGLEFWKHRIEILRQVNFSSAYTSLPSNLLVWQNLIVFAKLYGVPRPKQRIEELLELLDISHLRKSVTGKLSAGESTRVNLAKALLNEPRLLLLDEPTASLDPDIADRVRKLLRKLQKESQLRGATSSMRCSSTWFGELWQRGFSPQISATSARPAYSSRWPPNDGRQGPKGHQAGSCFGMPSKVKIFPKISLPISGSASIRPAPRRRK